MEYLHTHDGTEHSSRILYTPTAFAKQHCIYLQEAGELQATRCHSSRREYLHSYLFLAVTGGNGRLCYAGKEYPLHIGDCAFIDCRKEYLHEAQKEWSLRWVHFCGETMDAIYQHYRKNGGHIRFRPKNFLAYNDLLQEIYQCAGSEQHVNEWTLYEKLVTLLSMAAEDARHEITEGRNNGGNFRTLQTMQEIKQHLERQYSERITLDGLAEQFYMNKFYMTRMFKQQYGISIMHYLMQVRITRAKELLRFTDLSIEQIGLKCGISDANYFSRMFRKAEGVSPGTFRKLW